MDYNGQIAKSPHSISALGISFIAEFLNFPYASCARQAVKREDPLNRLKRLHPYYEEFEFEHAWDDAQVVLILQNVLRDSLDPLVEKPADNKGKVKNQRDIKAFVSNQKGLEGGLQGLITKINALHIEICEGVVSADKARLAYELDSMTGEPIPGTETEKPNPWLGSGRSILKTLDTRWLCIKTPVVKWSPEVKCLRKLLFIIINANLEKLRYLKKCQWCRKFFVRGDLRIRFCTPTHRTLYYYEAQRVYMQGKRAEDKKTADRQRVKDEESANRLQRERNLLPRFESLLNRRNMPLFLIEQVRDWRKSRRPATEILSSLPETDLRKLEKSLL